MIPLLEGGKKTQNPSLSAVTLRGLCSASSLTLAYARVFSVFTVRERKDAYNAVN